MRILIIGTLNGQIGAASQIAIKRGATVQQADTVEAGLQALRSGQGADLALIDVSLEIEKLIQCLESERIIIPVVACGTGTDTQAAVKAIRAGAMEYLPPDGTNCRRLRGNHESTLSSRIHVWPRSFVWPTRSPLATHLS